MNFEFTEEQVMLRNSVARFVENHYGMEKRRALVDSDTGFSAGNWQTFAELGWLAVPFVEEVGGYGGNPVDLMVLMEELGKGLVVEPYLATVLLFGGLVQARGSSAQQTELLGRVMAGELQGAFAFLERQSRFEMEQISTRVSQRGRDWVVDGEKTVVFNGASAEQFLVSARGEESADIGLFLVAAGADGVSRTSYRLMDGQRVANIRFDDAPATPLGDGGDALPAVEQVVATATLAQCAQAMGIMQFLQDTTVEYARTRQQFGVPIGSFQALQHRLVETFICCEQTRSLLYRAVCSAQQQFRQSSPQPSQQQQRDLHALKALVARHGQRVGAEAIQIHGGIGMTDELSVGHYVKCLMMINTCFGNGDYHQEKFNQLSYGAEVAA